MIMKKRTVSGIGYAVCSVLFLLFCACGNSDINSIKNGIMDGYETTTIGKAFDASFDETKWEAFESKKGEKVVQFAGKISEDLHKSASKIIAADFIPYFQTFVAIIFEIGFIRCSTCKTCMY